MKTSEIAVKSSESKFSYGWLVEKYRIVLHLGKMKNAVVIHESINGNYFKIGQASFFPFNDDIYNAKLHTIEEAKLLASTYVLEWLNDTNLALKNHE
jgi:hypothetical protein